MQIPFLNLKAQYDLLKDEIHPAIQQVLESTAFAGGPFVARFEEEFAPFCDCRFAVGVGSGTEALWLSLLALGVGPGDEVITVPNTFIATAEAISFCGATPVFVDVDEQTYNLDPRLIQRAVTAKTKAVLPVHLFGQMADMDPIIDVAHENGLFVVEDASQAHGAEYKGRKAGSIGDLGCFSFYPGKNLGAYGEAGAVVTNNDELKTKIQVLRDHGQTKKYIHAAIGWNARMDGIQGAILRVKLKYLSEANAARRKHARLYSRLFDGRDEIITPQEAEYGLHVFHIYAIRVKNRDQLLRALGEKGIACGIHYPKPLHLQEAYRFLELGRGSFPVAERCAEEFLSLPMFPELTGEQIETVSGEIDTLLETAPEKFTYETAG
jgi:dTDP-4-amino-4,6-dideoxygalactose transaminase